MAKRLATGELQHTLTIRAPIGVLSASEAVEVESGVPAKIEELPPVFQLNEFQAMGGVQHQTKYNVSMRYREDVRASFVLNEECHTQRVFQVVHVNPGDRRDALQLTCVTNG